MWSATSPAVQPSHGDSASHAPFASASSIARVSPAAAVRSRPTTSSAIDALERLEDDLHALMGGVLLDEVTRALDAPMRLLGCARHGCREQRFQPAGEVV